MACWQRIRQSACSITWWISRHFELFVVMCGHTMQTTYNDPYKLWWLMNGGGGNQVHAAAAPQLSSFPCCNPFMVFHTEELKNLRWPLWVVMIHELMNYTTLHYITLQYTALHHITLPYITLHYTIPHHTTLHYTDYITLHYRAPHNITLHYTPLHDSTLQCTTQTASYTPVHHITLLYTTLYPTTSHYIPIHPHNVRCTHPFTA